MSEKIFKDYIFRFVYENFFLGTVIKKKIVKWRGKINGKQRV